MNQKEIFLWYTVGQTLYTTFLAEHKLVVHHMTKATCERWTCQVFSTWSSETFILPLGNLQISWNYCICKMYAFVHFSVKKIPQFSPFPHRNLWHPLKKRLSRTRVLYVKKAYTYHFKKQHWKAKTLSISIRKKKKGKTSIHWGRKQKEEKYSNNK